MEEEKGLYRLLGREGKYASSEQFADEIAVQCNPEEDLSPATRRSSLKPKFSCNISGLVVIVIIFLSSVPMTAVVLRWMDSQSKTSRYESFAYSPILELISLPFHQKSIDARLYPEPTDPTAIFQSPPSPEVDEAWNRIGDNIVFGISREEVIRAGKDPESTLKMNPEWGVDDDSYLVEIDVFHQIHCLNSLRKALITNYDHYWGALYAFEPPVIFDTHLRHCQSILLQNIMCHSDVEVVTHVWQQDHPVPYPDFAINKQCRDFDAILAWKEANNLERAHHKFSTYRKPPGVETIPREPYAKQALGNATGFKYGSETKPIFVNGCNV